MSFEIANERPRGRLRPFTAMGRMRRLIADKEDTEQVFHIIEALGGKALERDLARFAASAHAPHMLRTKPSLPALLDDHANLRRLPIGSVGQAYVDFMEREGLTAAGLVDESEKFKQGKRRFDDDLEWYADRLRDTHDLFHVLTGYGRDPLGEACLLAFSYSQSGGPGLMFIAYLGAREIRRTSPRGMRIMDGVWEGKRHGKTAEKIVDQDIEALLSENLEAARKRLLIQKPVRYRALRSALAEVWDDYGAPPAA
ncbi:MAG: Coq4 family protein [Pseudomonadota bacterium]